MNGKGFFALMTTALILATPWISRGESGPTTIAGWQRDWQYQDPNGTYAVRKGEFIRIGNARLERVWHVAHDTVATNQLANKLSGREPGSQQWPEFCLRLNGNVNGEITAADCTLVDIARQAGKQALRVVFGLRHRTVPSLKVDVVVETYPDRSDQRKWLAIDYSGPGDVTVERIDVERTGSLGWWYIGAPTRCGMGQPMFVADLYLGLEHPAGETDHAYVRHHSGRSAKGGLRSKTAVWGVAKSPAELENSFFEDYLYTLQGVRRAEPFVIWNLLGVGLPEEKRLMGAAESIARQAKQAGFAIDSFAIDDTWQDLSSVWQSDPLRFPNGMGPLAGKLQTLGSRLGLWLSVMGLGLDTRWGQRQGLEVSTVADRDAGGRYCLAGPKYLAKIKETLTAHVRQYGVNYYKFDYNVFACDVPGHGHPSGPAGREAQIDAYIDVLQAIKATDPQCRIAITSNMWLSPWWIRYADWVWLGGSDMDSAKLRNLTPQDGNTTYRDAVMYEDFREKQYVFPYANVMTHGFWEAAGVPYAKFQDDVVMTIGRGITKWEILNDPNSMDPKRWTFMGRAMRWGRANWDLLAHTQMILGNPGKGEIYGYAHAGPGAALVFLRNPDLESKLLALSLRDLGLLPEDPLMKAKDLTAVEVYPTCREIDWSGAAASPLMLHVLGSETKVIAVISDKGLQERLKL